jgi:hypothetical protein
MGMSFNFQLDPGRWSSSITSRRFGYHHLPGEQSIFSAGVPSHAAQPFIFAGDRRAGPVHLQLDPHQEAILHCTGIRFFGHTRTIRSRPLSSRLSLPGASSIPLIGAGARIYLGTNFTEVEGHIVIADLIRKYRFSLKAEKIPSEALITLRPKGGSRSSSGCAGRNRIPDRRRKNPFSGVLAVIIVGIRGASRPGDDLFSISFLN